VKSYRIAFGLIMAVALSATALAGTTGKQAFERLKKLEGSWKRKASDTDIQVVFKLTGAGSALVETQFPGTSNEMVTVYHLDGNDLVLTHYCAAQNQPRMKLAAVKDPKVLQFNFVSVTNLKPKAGYMRSVKYHLIDGDHYTAEWAYYANGKSAGSAKFELTRAK
jgi:hypothetical protein